MGRSESIGECHVPDVILAFLAKGYLVDRWLKLDADKGKHLFRKLVDEVRGTYDKNKLIYYGYFNIDADAYKNRRYHIRKEIYYLVQGEFPRIKKGDLLLGVSDVKYTITLAVPAENNIEENNVLKTILSYERNQ